MPSTLSCSKQLTHLSLEDYAQLRLNPYENSEFHAIAASRKTIKLFLLIATSGDCLFFTFHFFKDLDSFYFTSFLVFCFAQFLTFRFNLCHLFHLIRSLKFFSTGQDYWLTFIVELLRNYSHLCLLYNC